MPLDLFSIARGLKAGQEAYSQGQKEQADRYWSDIENSLKVAASAQELKQATELQPLKALSEQALEFQRRRAGEYSGARATTEEVLRGPSLKLKEEQAFSAEQLGKTREIKAKTDQQILDALQSGYSKFQLENPDSKASYNEWLYQNYPDLGPAIEKAKEAVKTQEETTKLRTAQATGAEQKVTTGIEERKAYETLGTTPGAVVAGTEIAKMEKAKSDVDLAKATLSLRKLQADVAGARAKAIKEGKLPADMLPSQKKNQIQVDAMEELIAGGMDPGEAYNQVVNQPKTLSYANISSMLNKLRDQASMTPDGVEKDALNEKIKLYESILQPALDRMAGKPKGEVEPTKEQTISTSSADFRQWTPAQRTSWLRQTANMGTRRIELVDPDNKVISIINIKQDTNGDYIISDSKGNQLTRISRLAPKAQAKPTGSVDPRAIAIVEVLKANGITDISQEKPENITKYKQAGIYEQIVSLLRQR